MSLVDVVARAGLLPANTLAEFRRWGMILHEPPPSEPMTAGQVLASLSHALEEEGMVLMRETDLGALHQFIKTQKVGVLHIVLDGKRVEGFQVFFGRTLTSEVMIPWTDEDFEELEGLLTNGETHLETDEGEVYFTSCRRLFFGERQGFIVCEVAHDPA